MTMPTFQVLLDDATNSGTFPYDITSYVRLVDGVTVTRGRGDEFEDIQPSTLSMTLENLDGRFTLGSTVGGYGAINVDRRIRYVVTPSFPIVAFTRFTGYVQTWPVEWPDGGDTFAVAQITAVDSMARMARRTLRSIVEEEYLLDDPSIYWTFGDPVGSTQAGDTSGVLGLPMSAAVYPGGTGSVTFGSATGPGTDSLTGATLVKDGYLSTPYQANAANPSAAFTIEMFFTASTVAPFNEILGSFATTTMTNGIGVAWFAITSSGFAQAFATNASLSVQSITGSTNLCDGRVHHLALTATSTTATLYVDGASVGSVTLTGGIGGLNGSFAYSMSTAQVGNTWTFNAFHYAVYPTALGSARIASHWLAGSTGFAGEDSGHRLSRLAGYGGLVGGTTGSVNTSVPFADITGTSLLGAISDVEKAEGGVFYIQPTGTWQGEDRGFRARRTTPDLALTNDDIDSSSKVVADMQLVTNVVTASAGQSGAIQVIASATSRATHGDYPTDLNNLLVSTDELALNAAQWRVAKYAEAFPRMPDLMLDLTTLPAATQFNVLSTGLGFHVQITGLPSQAGSSTLDLIVEGWTETLSHDSWEWTANTSNFAAASAWVLGDATYGVLNSTTLLGY